MLPRRTLDEWLTSVKIGRSTRYTVVEGPSDEDILTSFLGSARAAEVTEIGKIQIELADPPSPFLGGNRARLWTLAKKIGERRLDNAVCLIDSDFEPMYSSLPRSAQIILTDFANLPSGFCDREFMAGFLMRGYQVRIGVAHWDEFSLIFKRLFILRYWKAIYKPASGLPDAADYLACIDLMPDYQWQAFFNRYAAILADGTTGADIAAEVTSIEAIVNGDPRQFVHSDDLFNLIHRYLRLRRRVPNTTTVAGVRSALLGAMSALRPGQENLSRLIAWLTWKPGAVLP
jgi:hypothetical protein